jgi:hypothetical protein
LPGNPGGIEHPLQRMTRNAELFAVIGQQVVKGLLTVILKGCTKTPFDPLRAASNLAAKASCAR